MEFLRGSLPTLRSSLVCTSAASSLPSVIPGTQGLTHVLGRQGKLMWLIVVRQLSMKASWWDAPLSLRDLAEAICIILNMGSFCPILLPWGLLSWLSSCCPSYPYTQLYFPSELISDRFPHRHYPEIPPSHSRPPKRTCSTVSTLSLSQHLLHPRIPPPIL